MAPEEKGQHTTRYFTYRAFGLGAYLVAIVPFFVYGVNMPVLTLAAVNLLIGTLLFLSARAAERNERRTHFTFSTFFSNPWTACTKIILLAVVLVALTVVVPATWWVKIRISRWWVVAGITAMAVLVEAFWDWREVRRSIHVAVCSGRPRWVQRIVDANPAMVNVIGAYRRTPLHLAAALGHTRIAEILLDAGADVNAKADGGWTALHWAAMIGRKHLVRRLVEDGAEVNAVAEDDSTPLNWALRNGHEDVATILRWHGAE